MATICLHFTAAIYLVLGLLVFGFSFHPSFREELPASFGLGALIFCLALVAGLEIVASGLRRRKFWAWVAGLCIFGLYVQSLFLPFGALGLWGLLDSGSRTAFGIGTSGPPS